MVTLERRSVLFRELLLSRSLKSIPNERMNEVKNIRTFKKFSLEYGAEI